MRVWENVQRLADENGIKIKLPNVLSNSRNALITSEFARKFGKFNDFHESIFNAYFLKLKNIEKDKVLLKIIKKLNLNPDQLELAWIDNKYFEILQKSKQELYSIGIT